MIFVKRMAALLCGVSALTAPSLALAQAAPQEPAASDAPSTASEIVVTATRSNEKLKDVAMSVNVATGDQLEALKIFDVKDVSQLAPGLELTNNAGRNNITTLRGVTFDPDQGTGPAVQVYLNEIPTDAQTVYTAIYDIQQIEVLRGPQGLLRGLSAPAGSITIATRRPSFDKIEGYAQASGTNRDAYNVQGGISLPIGDKLALRVAGLVDGNRVNNVVDVNRNGERSRGHTESARATLGWKPSPDFSAYLTYQYLHADIKQFQQVVGPGNTPYGIYSLFFGTPKDLVPAAFGGGPFTTDTTVRSGPALGALNYAAVTDGVARNINLTHVINLATDWNLGAATLSFVGAHQFSKLTQTRDLDNGNALPGFVKPGPVLTPYYVSTGELRLRSNNDEGLGWGVGAFYTKQTGTVQTSSDATLFLYGVAPTALVNPPCALVGGAAAGCPGNFAPYTIPNALGLTANVTVPVKTQTTSFNANLRYKAGRLKIEGGIRYSILDSTQTTQLGLTGFFTQPSAEIIPAALQHFVQHPLTGGANVSYEVTPEINVYAAYGHSFRSGSTGVSTPAGISNDLIRTRPEKTDSYEIGVKGSVMEHRVNFAVSAYYQTLDGYLARFGGIYYNCPTLNGSCSTSPAAMRSNNPATNGSFDFNYNGDATIKGIEASFDGLIAPNWNLGVSASYTHARYKNALLPCNDFAGIGSPNQTGAPKITGTGNVSFCKSNGRISDTPDFSLTSNTEIRFPVGNVVPYVSALFTYRPGFHSDQVNYDYVDRELLNMFVGIRSSNRKWDFSLFARNLLDQQRITNISLGNQTVSAIVDGTTFNSGYRTVNVTIPREFGATLKVTW